MRSLAKGALAGVLLAVGGTIAATVPAAADPVNLTLRYCWGGDAEMAAMQKVIDGWNTANPDVQVKGIGGDIGAEEIVADAAGGNPPDMVIMCDNSAVAGFAHDGVIAPLDDLLKTIGADTSNIIPSSLAWTQYGGKQYGLPFGQDTYALYYDVDAFKEAGLDPAKPPTTLDELWDDAAKLTKWNADGSLARAGFIPNDPYKNLEQTSALFDCQFYDDASKKVTINSQACVDWLNWFKTWYDTYNKNNALVTVIASRTGGDAGLLISGQQAMGIYGEWNTGAAYIPVVAPNLHYETAPIPSLDPALYGAGFMNGNAFMIMAGSKHQQEAAKFGMYLMTDDASKVMILQNSSVPQLKSLLTDPQLTSIPHFTAFLKIAAHPKSWTTPMISAYSQLIDGLNNALDAVLTGGADPKQQLDDLASTIQAQLDANGA
jgi:ABC-type glycerol-3-phosphate transport system substrate-binding protein